MDKPTVTALTAGIMIAGVAALAGCGGGGGGSSATTSATMVSGTAAKGLIKQARVLVCRIVNGVPEADASCGSTTTGNDGSYRVTLNDGYTGPAMIKVMAGTASTMMDETTGIDIPYAMTMRAVIPAVSGATSAQVTPFTEMAASAASMTTMTPATINQAIAAVQGALLSLGIDLSVMPVIDLKDDGTNPAMLALQSNMVKQMSRIAMAAKNASSLTDASGVPCNAAGTTASQQFSCAVAAMAAVMNSYATTDPTKLAAMLAILNAQKVTSVTIPIMRADGTIQMEMVDMTSLTSMQAAMQRAGMTADMTANTVPAMMGGMH